MSALIFRKLFTCSRIRHCEPTGRRKAPPDDRLREAIHGATGSKNGLLRRFAPRNDGETQLNIPAAQSARVVQEPVAPIKGSGATPRGERRYPKRGAGNAGCPLHPQPRAQW
jgi:hypothetical protein